MQYTYRTKKAASQKARSLKKAGKSPTIRRNARKGKDTFTTRW